MGRNPLNDNHLTGVESELTAARYFISEGMAVYWPMVRQSAHDFAVQGLDGEFFTVQVKTAQWNRASPPFHYLQCRTRLASGQSPQSDLFVAVFGDEIWAIPSTAIDSSNLSLRSTREGSSSRWTEYKKR